MVFGLFYCCLNCLYLSWCLCSWVTDERATFLIFSFLHASGRPLIISHNGASGDYPDCTDLAYQKAVKDGADVIDCPVQVTKDRILICMNSIDLLTDTTVTRSPFSSHTSIIPDIKMTPGIYTFNLTWSEIQRNLQRKLIYVPFLCILPLI